MLSKEEARRFIKLEDENKRLRKALLAEFLVHDFECNAWQRGTTKIFSCSCKAEMRAKIEIDRLIRDESHLEL